MRSPGAVLTAVYAAPRSYHTPSGSMVQEEMRSHWWVKGHLGAKDPCPTESGISSNNFEVPTGDMSLTRITKTWETQSIVLT